jgi:hypothetical protein
VGIGIASPDPLRPIGLPGRFEPGTTGLLATRWGRVTQIDPSGSYFCIDNGGGPVRVAFDGRPYDTSKMLAVPGVSSCYLDSGVAHALVLVRCPEDIVGL